MGRRSEEKKRRQKMRQAWYDDVLLPRLVAARMVAQHDSELRTVDNFKTYAVFVAYRNRVTLLHTLDQIIYRYGG